MNAPTPPETSPASAAPRHSAQMIAAPVLILAVFLIGFAMFIGWPRWPVVDAGERVAYSAMAAAGLACAATLVRRCWIRALLNLLAAAACVVPVLLPMVRPNDWTYATLVLWTAGVCVPVAMLASLAQRLRASDGSLLVIVVTLGMTLASGALLLSTGSFKLGTAGFSLAAGVAIITILGLFLQGIARSDGAITLAFAILAALLASGYVWSETPLYAGLAVFAAPLIAWVVRLRWIARRAPWQRVVIGLLLAAVPAAVAVTIEGLKANAASQASDDYGY